MSIPTDLELLRQLARVYGVDGKWGAREGWPEEPALIMVLQALGAPVEKAVDVPNGLREARLAVWRRVSEPVAVAWDGEPVRLGLRLPVRCLRGCFEGRLALEGGRGELGFSCHPRDLPLISAARIEGESYELRRLTLPLSLPWGYHRLRLDLPGSPNDTLVIAAPRRTYVPPGRAAGRVWGGFMPLYALHSGRSWGAGDLTDMEHVLRRLRGLGAGFFGTLPLLPAFLDEPFDPSPYAPVSRLFWNEFYLDVTKVEEAKRPQIRELIDCPGARVEISALRALPLVEYRRVMHLKRRVLERCAQLLLNEDSARSAAFHAWVADHPRARDYARFRATTERMRVGWPEWPERMRDGSLEDGDFDPAAADYHLYVQWLAQQQFNDLAARARGNGRGLYLDLPLGVHRAGYDVWRGRSAFTLGASAGAPPDALSPGGQNWGFPPLHPERIREQGYRYYIDCLRHHLRLAGILRLDHVAGLHRLFWVPQGCSARNGVYVRYRAEEFYAILALESRRHRAVVVGEDLGTVPDYVRAAMARHRVHGMYVLPFESTGDPERRLRPVRSLSLACLNTHDMPPFAGFWHHHRDDPEWATLPACLHRRGFMNTPTDEVGPVCEACLAHLAAGRARIMLVNLEDLWLENEPQNVPGTGEERPNWRRKACYALDDFTRDHKVLSLLQKVDRLRRS